MERGRDARSAHALAHRVKVLEGANRVLSGALSAATDEQLVQLCLAAAEDASGAAVSFMGWTDPATDRLVGVVIGVRAGAAAEHPRGPPPDPPIPAGFDVQRLHRLMPSGGASLVADVGQGAFGSFLGISLLREDGTPGMIGLGKRAGGFRPEDVEAAEALAPSILQALASRSRDPAARAGPAGSSTLQSALRESEERLRRFGEASQDVLWIRDAETLQWRYLTPAFEQIYGLSREAALRGNGYGNWLELIVPEDRPRAAENIARVRAGEKAEFDYRIRRPSDGAVRSLRNIDFPIADETGRVTLIGGIGHDITGAKRAEEHQEILLAELQHRVRNILAVTRSIVSHTNDGERSTEDYVQHLLGRISALARTEALLTRAAGAGVELQELLRDELLVQVASDEKFLVEGPDVELSSKTAEVLTLAVHELATNATKYGAFSRASGRLKVSWRLEARDGQDWLVLSWRESGVAIVDPAPRHSGFGAELILRRVPYELKGVARFDLLPGGLHSTIEFPLVARDSLVRGAWAR